MKGNFLTNFDWSLKSIAKALGLLVFGIIALGLIASLFSFSMRTLSGISFFQNMMSGANYATDSGYVGGAPMYSKEAVSADSFARGGFYQPVPPAPSYATGTDAENYDLQEYSGTIETGSLNKTCDRIEALKAKDYVIFDNANRSDSSCNFSFKVAKANTDEVLNLIKELDPKFFSDNVSTIKATVEGMDNELDIQTGKLKTLKSRMEDQINEYDSIFEVAKRTNNVDAMTNIVINKQNYITQIENEMSYIQENITRLTTGKTGELDRLDYTFFNISVTEVLLLDWDHIKDSWKAAVQNLVMNFNNAIQGISLQLIGFLIVMVQAVLYLFITVFVVKYVWKGVKWIWKGKK